MSTSADNLEEFVCNEVSSLCDADPKVLAQYIIALIGKGEHNNALRASLEDKLKEFFEDQTTPFIDRLFTKLSSNSSKSSKESSDRFNAYSDEEDDDGDRNFKHRRQRSETRDRTDFSEQNKRRYADESSYHSNKHFRSNSDDRRGPYSMPSGPTGGYSPFDRGRGRGGSRGFTGRGMAKPPMCRDYMEKGYCMRGDTCPFDHGRDRIIVEDTNNNNPLPPTGSGSMPNRGGPNQPFVGMNDAYDPERALLPPDNTSLPSDMRGLMQRRGGFRGGGRGGRGGFRNQNNKPTNTTLTVEKIPPESCQISTVNDFFAKFGTITNISVLPHAQKAVIQYATRAEAENAYTCPDAVFDNRFVKVYWNRDETVTAPVTGANTVPSTEEPEQENSNKRKADEPDPEAVAARAAELAKIREEKHKKHQEHMKIILDAQKKREHQLQQQIEEQKRLLGKLTSGSSMGTEEKAEILKQLKSVQSAIENTQNAALVPVSSTNEISESKEQTSADLQKKLEHLEAEASLLGVNAGIPYPGRGGYFGRGRGSWPRSRGGFTRMTLDNRPTKILIKDVPQDTTEEELRQHFEQYGQVTLFEKTELEATVQYAQRFLAEKAMSFGPNFPKGKLQLSWSTDIKTIPTESTEPIQSTGPTESTEPTASSKITESSNPVTTTGSSTVPSTEIS